MRPAAAASWLGGFVLGLRMVRIESSQGKAAVTLLRYMDMGRAQIPQNQKLLAVPLFDLYDKPQVPACSRPVRLCVPAFRLVPCTRRSAA